jgi:ABC-type transport system substrate-binding protein
MTENPSRSGEPGSEPVVEANKIGVRKPKKRTSPAGPKVHRGVVERVAAALASGDLGADLQTELSSEELGSQQGSAFQELSVMARSMRRTVARLQRAADAVENIANRVLEGGRSLAISVGDEAASVDATVSSIAEISASARAVTEAVNALSVLAQTTSTSSLEMAASIDEVSANADSLTSFVEETASSIEEMAASVRNVAAATESLASVTNEAERSMRAIDDSTQRVGMAVGETALLAEEVQRSAEEGLTVVLKTAESMRATRLSVEENERIIGDLGRRSERIGEITGVIDEIADRTNLLALNARILAAQAGQQGRGFGVVAEEIKELSERTARSTEEISELIKGVRESVAAAVSQAKSNRQLADEGARMADEAATSLNEISHKTGLSATAIRRIAEAAATQSLESHQVTELVGQVRRRAQEIERATSEQAQTSKQIGERAVHMAELTEQVRRAMEEQADASKHIAGAIEQLTELVQQIGGAVGEQHRGVEDVLKAMEVIRDSVKKNQASIVQINYTVGLLDHEAVSLRDTVGQFKLPAPSRGGHLRYGVASSIPTLDALESSTLAGNDLLSLIFECLVNPGGGAEVEPSLAESWEISADGRVYRFTLTRGARFHNGREVVADDVVYSVRRTLRESKAGAWVFASLVGAAEFAAGETEELAGARAIDNMVVELELVEPLAFFLPMLCLRYCAIVPREEIEPAGGINFVKHPVGTGPFILASYDRDRSLVDLVRFDEYWKSDEPYVDSLTVEYSDNGERLFERLKAGELDFTREDSAERIAQLKTDPEWRSCLISASQLHTQCLVLDAEQSPFDDIRVRRAMAHAIDKDALVREAYAGMAVPAAGPIPPGLIGHDPDYRGLEYDPDRARQLLVRAGYRRGLRVKFWRSFQEQTASDRAGSLICEQLGAVGIDCEIEVTDTADLLAAAHDGRAALAEFSWYADYADPDNYTFVLFHSANRQSSIGRTVKVPEIDRLSSVARSIVNRAERARIYNELQRLIAEHALCVFTAHRRAAVVHRPGVEGLHVHLVSPVVRPQEVWLTDARKSNKP